MSAVSGFPSADRTFKAEIMRFSDPFPSVSSKHSFRDFKGVGSMISLEVFFKVETAYSPKHTKSLLAVIFSSVLPFSSKVMSLSILSLGGFADDLPLKRGSNDWPLTGLNPALLSNSMSEDKSSAQDNRGRAIKSNPRSTGINVGDSFIGCMASNLNQKPSVGNHKFCYFKFRRNRTENETMNGINVKKAPSFYPGAF